MADFETKTLPGWRALPGDLLYLEPAGGDSGGGDRGDHGGADALAPGYYVLAGQHAPDEVLLRRADEGGGGDLLPVSVRTLTRMVALAGRAPDDPGAGAGD